MAHSTTRPTQPGGLIVIGRGSSESARDHPRTLVPEHSALITAISRRSVPAAASILRLLPPLAPDSSFSSLQRLQEAWATCWQRLTARLDRMPASAFFALSALGAILLSVCFFAPRFTVWRVETPGSFEWDRGLEFVEQCLAPWVPSNEPALQWRYLPPWVAWLTGLRGKSALILPWIGLFAWLATSAALIVRRTGDRVLALAAACLLGTTGGAFTITTWFGMNDGWYLVGLTVLALGRGHWTLILPTLLCPWIDERFILALPLTWLCRRWLAERRMEPVPWFLREWLVLGCGIAIYGAVRIGLSGPSAGKGELEFLRNVSRDVPLFVTSVPLGWFMGWRAAWFVVLAIPVVAWINGQRWVAARFFATTLVTMVVLVIVATDLSRSVIALLPLALTAIVAAAGSIERRQAASLALTGLVVLNLFLPYAHITSDNVYLVNSLPSELIRYWNSCGT